MKSSKLRAKSKMLFQERKQIVICVLAGAVIGGFLLFRYIPLRKRVKAVEQAKAAQALVIAKALAESKQLPLLEEQSLKLMAKVADYQANVPVQRDIGVFLRKIADLMNEHNLKEQVLAPGNEIQADELRCIPIDMQCKGKLAQISEFYKQLQRLDRLVRIERVELVNDNSFNGEVTMKTKAVIYYRAEVGQG
jgi:type IV pilus assembly protein PilO